MFLPENIPLISKISGTQIQLAATYLGQNGRVNIGGQQYRLTNVLNCNLATTGYGGLDTGSLAANTLYYIYLVVNGSNVPGLVCSTLAPGTGPTGFTAWREIGRFRTYLGSAVISKPVNRLIGARTKSIIEESQTVTVTGSWSTNTTYIAKETIRGSWALYDITVSLSGAPDAAQLTINLPDGRSINTSAWSHGTDLTNYMIDGSSVNILETIGPQSYVGSVAYNSTSSVRIKYNAVISSVVVEPNNNVASGAPNTMSSGDKLYIKFMVPIAEYAGLFDD